MRSAFLIILVLAIFARADEFDAANQLFDAGKFDEARQHYSALVERGEWSANLFYNLGNAEYRTGSPGRAMLAYERALVLDPAHSEARGNLKVLRGQANAKIPERTWLDMAFGSFSLDAWVLLATISAWGIVFCIVVPLATRRPLPAALIFAMVLAVFAMAYGAAGAWYTSQDREAGIIVAKQVDARFEPADRAGLADVLPAGSRVRVLSERGAWTYCELPGKGRGWVPAASVQRVRLSKS
jgi:tetratricopeptide (TPR) repeat protein